MGWQDWGRHDRARRQDWHEREDERRRMALRRDRDDFGQADYSEDYAFDPETRSGYRAEQDIHPRVDDFGQADYSADYAYDIDDGRAYRRAEQPRSWAGPADARRSRRRDSSDRVLWAVIVERLADQRGLDLRDVEVMVENREVTLNGTVRHKADKRRVEDIADIDGVRHVQNNLRVRDRPHWTFL